MKKPRELTREEVRDNFLEHVRKIVEYWGKLDAPVVDRLGGVAFSMLAAFDGCSELPAFILAPRPHPEDKEYNIGEGDNYYPENNKEVNCDISGELHENFFKE